jgi:2',3'-cyclic-nucleotide 2'-phosphodiesterase (5'-nucleotidase family)
MTQSLRKYFLFFLVSLSIAGCKPSWFLAGKKASQYRIKQDTPKDTALINFLNPYYRQMAATMDKVIAISDVELIKKQPSCNMGNFFSDIVKVTAASEFNTSVDLAIFNHGGMRLTSLAPGNVTVGKVFELSPFDNLIVILKLDGKTLQDFLNLSAAKGGWPVSGATYIIKDKKATNVLISGKAIEENKTYNVATIDYIANGGDEADMLRSIPQLNKNIIMRDAIIRYLEKLTEEGKHIVDIPEKRVEYAQ